MSLSNKWIVLILLLVFFSCVGVENQIEVKDFEEHVVINGLLEAGRNPVVHVSRTSVDFNNPIAGDDDAMVILYENGVELAELVNIGNGIYKDDSVLYKLGNKYGLSVDAAEKNFFVENEIPIPREIYGVEFIKDAGRDLENRLYPGAKIYVSNDPNKRLFFMLEVYEEGNRNEFNWSRYEDLNDTLFTRHGLDLPVFTNANVPGDTLEIQFNYNSQYNTVIYGDSIAYLWKPFYVRLISLSEDYYEFIRSEYLYEQGRFPEPLITNYPSSSVYSNIENGRGIFAGFSATQSDTIRP